MDIQISCQYKKNSNLLRIVSARLKRFAASFKDNKKIFVAFVDDATIQDLNFRFKKLKKTTNVLSFQIDQTDPEDGKIIIGEVVVSVDTAAREAARARMNIHERLTELFIHGLVHLTGYDHTRSSKEAIKMRRKEKELMKRVAMIEKTYYKRV